jgi:hypothetical protein
MSKGKAMPATAILHFQEQVRFEDRIEKDLQMQLSIHYEIILNLPLSF